MKQQKYCVFDLDGTLINSLPSISFSLNSTLSALKLPQVSDTKIKCWIGNGSDVLVQRGLSNDSNISSTLCLKQAEQAKKLFNDYYESCGHDIDNVFEQVHETLSVLKKHHVKMAVLTNKTSCFIQPILSHFNLDTFFELAVGGDSLKDKKPDPIGLYYIAKHFNCQPQSLFMIGDSKNDILCAKQANAKSIGVDYGYNYGLPIANEKPDHVISHFKDILPIILD